MIVKVAFPISVTGLFDYTVPNRFIPHICIGTPVKVTLRNRHLWGIVVQITDSSPYANLKEILELKSDKWNTSSQSLIQLYSWIAAYYHTELGKVFKPLLRKKLADAKPKTITLFTFSGEISESLSQRQKEAAEQCKGLDSPVSRKYLIENFNLSPHLIQMLVVKKVLCKSLHTLMRHPLELNQKITKKETVLSTEQKEAIQHIWNGFHRNKKAILLHGITGSGKTYVYIDLVKTVLQSGKNIIILVPEISLTPQTIKRFRDAIDCDIAVIHSRMSNGERRDTMEDIVSGEKRIIIGVRSAILVPLDNVGLIIVDEEHDGSYKQSDQDPRYNSRDVAIMRGHFQHALVLLGSATPSFESYNNALSGKYTLITLTQRYGKATLPKVQIVDMHSEGKHNNWTFISRIMAQKIQETLDMEKQIILLLNRRGYSIFLLCKQCGHLYGCPYCSVKLIYHKSDFSLTCHQCGYTLPVPERCSICGGEQITFKGTGIQKAEEYLSSLFKGARILRMDQDTTRKKGSHISLYETFLEKKADILLGTQMVAKGLNFPDVRLVGVLQADIGLHFPDFRAAERTFQLLAQVAGRAGRNDNLGEVIVQTYSPNEPCITATKEHNFISFYTNEIKSRESLGYPPLGRLVRIITQGKDENQVKNLIHSIARSFVHSNGSAFTLLGPAPAVISKIKSLYRYSLLIKSKHPKQLQAALQLIKMHYQQSPQKTKLIIDVDPYNML